MELALILRLMPALVALLNDPTVKGLLAQVGQGTPPSAASVVFDTNVTKWVQTALNLLGDHDLKVDGKYGELTKAAVRRFQTKYSLTADGWAGDQTQVKLREVFAGLVGVEP